MARTRRVDTNGPGITRVKRGRGFSYHEEDGTTISDKATLDRIRALAIPPAWTNVWICPHPRGHVQATGSDVAGRKQYRYHDDWRESRDRLKFEEMEDFAKALPKLREQPRQEPAQARPRFRTGLLMRGRGCSTSASSASAASATRPRTRATG